MRNTRNILFVSLYTILFSLILFVGREIFFPQAQREEQHTEPVLGEYFSDIQDTDFRHTHIDDGHTDVSDPVVQKLIYESFKQRYNEQQRSKVFLRYIPNSFINDIKYSYTPLVEVFLYKKDILTHINKLGVFLYKNRDVTRGRMKSGNIHMYGVEKMTDSEFLAVLLHEFGHYFDIYSLPNTGFGDRSQDFYDISWNSVSIMKEGSKGEDFVSGYSMTNQYEDFAETYIYYILHNEDFIYRSLSNDILAKKYNFMREYIFPKNQFLQEDFSNEPVKEYYWDITKLDVDVKNFLQYIQEDI